MVKSKLCFYCQCLIHLEKKARGEEEVEEEVGEGSETDKLLCASFIETERSLEEGEGRAKKAEERCLCLIFINNP